MSVDELLRWPPDFCKWCNWRAKMSMRHRPSCPSYKPGIAADEIVPGLYVGDVETRADPRWAAVISILTQGEMLYYREIPMPMAGTWLTIDHADQKPGLLAKCEAAWRQMDELACPPRPDLSSVCDRCGAWSGTPCTGVPVLIHCGAGASRSPTVLMGWLITRRGYTAQAALRLLVEKRPHVMHLWPGFVRELEELGRSLLRGEGP